MGGGTLSALLELPTLLGGGVGLIDDGKPNLGQQPQQAVLPRHLHHLLLSQLVRLLRDCVHTTLSEKAAIIRHTSLANPQHPRLNIFTGNSTKQQLPIQIYGFHIEAAPICMQPAIAVGITGPCSDVPSSHTKGPSGAFSADQSSGVTKAALQMA